MARVQDGLFWDFVDPRRPWRNVYGDSDRRYGAGRDENFCVPSHTARMMRAVMVRWQTTGDARYRQAADDLSAGMRRIALDRDDCSFFPEKGGWGEPTTYPRSGWVDTAEARDETEGVEGSTTGYHARPIYAAALWHRLSGNRVALELARRMARYCLQPRFWGGRPDADRARARAQGLPGHIAARLPDPACTAGGELGHWYTHFHARASVLRAAGVCACGRRPGGEGVRAAQLRVHAEPWHRAYRLDRLLPRRHQPDGRLRHGRPGHSRRPPDGRRPGRLLGRRGCHCRPPPRRMPARGRRSPAAGGRRLRRDEGSRGVPPRRGELGPGD